MNYKTVLESYGFVMSTEDAESGYHHFCNGEGAYLMTWNSGRTWSGRIAGRTFTSRGFDIVQNLLERLL